MTNKRRVLDMLSFDHRTSGEEIAKDLGITRMGVSKIVSSLRKDGYLIDSSTKTGYIRKNDVDILSFDTLEPLLENSGVKVYYYDEIDSTNREARTLLSSGIKPPFVVVAASQYGGRGRLDRSFSSPQGGAYFSLALSGSEIKSNELVTLSAAAAITRVIEKMTRKKCGIKWVNDIFINNKKCTGILSEGFFNMEEGRLESVIIGCGVNLKSKIRDFPIELRDIVTSIYPDGETKIKRCEFIAECVKEIIAIQKEDFLPYYREKCFILGRDVMVDKNGEKKEAKAESIDENGKLVVRYNDGIEESLFTGEVSIRF